MKTKKDKMNISESRQKATELINEVFKEEVIVIDGEEIYKHDAEMIAESMGLSLVQSEKNNWFME